MRLALIILSLNLTTRSSSNLAFQHGSSSSEFECDLEAQIAENSPWAVTIQVLIENSTAGVEYYNSVILDAYTILTYARPGPFDYENFDRFSLPPPNNCSVLIGAVRSGTTNVKFLQKIEVSLIQLHPNFQYGVDDGFDVWARNDNDYVIFRLKEPIKFTREIQPICLPKIPQELDHLYSVNSTVLISGWRKTTDLIKTSLTIVLAPEEKCRKEWKAKIGNGSGRLYKNRVCGYVSPGQNSNNPKDSCIIKDSGAFINNNGKFIFMGFVNTFFSEAYEGFCKEGVLFFIFKLNPLTLKWLKGTMACSSSQYTCHNGECVSIHSLCNRKRDSCSDSSDEDAKYCRALNQCKGDQIPCGIYGKCIPINSSVEEFCVENLGNYDQTPSSTNATHAIIIGSSVGLALFALLTFGLLWWTRTRHLRPTWSFGITEGKYLEFLNGRINIENDEESEVERVAHLKFDKNLEIAKSNITKGKRINGGHFGDVFMGKIKGDTKCAIKVPKFSASMDQIDRFLKELKIMSYVGQHDNIVELLGASTKHIREGILYIIVEYCEFGCLTDFLTKNSWCFCNEDEPDDPEPDPEPQLENNPLQSPTSNPRYVSVGNIFYVTDLIRWGCQIAAGMAHLARKNVIHGDLAARNVLLDGNKTAKICDFGLSHKLYSKIRYPLPPEAFCCPREWRSPEVFRDMKLSIKSDVWSFGITLWEIFSLGIEPYSDAQDFLPAQSYQGCTLAQPKLASPEIFQIMQDCWALNPDERPDFEMLENLLSPNPSFIETAL